MVPNLDTARARLPAATKAFVDTKFDLISNCNEYITAKCPWGNIFHLYYARDDDKLELSSESALEMAKLHDVGGLYSPHRISHDRET